MSYPCLALLLEKLESVGELVRIAPPVAPSLEAAELVRSTTRKPFPAILFSDIDGRDFAVVANLLGTESRIAAALGLASLEDLKARVAELFSPPETTAWYDRMLGGVGRSGSARAAPKTVRTGACQQVVRLGGDVDLQRLPALRTSERETYPLITAGLFLTRDPRTDRTYVGRHDAAVLDRTRWAVHCDPHEELAAITAEYARQGSPMPAALVLGADPALLLAAEAPLPAGADLLTVAGVLRDKPLELVPGRSIPLELPADAEIVIEGVCDPNAPPQETGFLTASNGRLRKAPPARVFHVGAMTHRTNPIFPAMVRSRPPHEETVIRRTMQRFFLPAVLPTLPELVAWDFPSFGAARHYAFAAIRKSRPGQARRAALALWGLPQTMFAKILVVVDEDVDVSRPSEVFEAVATHADLGRDVFFQKGAIDPWDPASGDGFSADRMAIDATRKLPGESPTADLETCEADEAIRKLVAARRHEYGLD